MWFHRQHICSAVLTSRILGEPLVSSWYLVTMAQRQVHSGMYTYWDDTITEMAVPVQLVRPRCVLLIKAHAARGNYRLK